ncbi:hypothetical protein [Sphingomonas montana]|nr:hypothetical protein [Sphingomonas montana]
MMQLERIGSADRPCGPPFQGWAASRRVTPHAARMPVVPRGSGLRSAAS